MNKITEKIESLVENAFTVSDEAFSSAPNPWLNAKRRWNEIFGSLVSTIKFLMIVTILSWTVTIGTSLALVKAALSPKFVPYIVEVDSHGSVVHAGIPKQSEANQTILSRELSELVINLRSVVRDTTAQRRYVDKVYAYLLEGNPGTKTITDWYSKYDPFSRGASELVSVQVESALSLGPKTWQLEWRETPSDLSGNAKPALRYRALITTEFFEIKKQEAIPPNPFGLFIKDISISSIGG